MADDCYFQEDGGPIGMPIYQPDIRDWEGRRFDLGMYWLQPMKGPQGERDFRVCHPDGAFYDSGVSDSSVFGFISWVRKELIKKWVEKDG